jgi:L-ascorbate metabolism protein UlaG (beta-lactamase superfamily)
MKFLIVLGVLAIGSFLFLSFYKPFGQAPSKDRIKNSPQYKDGVFVNKVTTEAGSLADAPRIIKDYINRDTEATPMETYTFSEVGKPSENALSFNWLGHATLLIKIEDKYILTDPTFSKTVSPFSWLGPKRWFKSPINNEAIPQLEAIIISHDHYDHLDYETIQALSEKCKHFIVPLGVAETLWLWGIPKEKVKEVDWGDEVQLAADITVISTPARHFSGRLFKRNNTLWSSYVIKSKTSSIYFGGDTGTFTDFKSIAEKHGPFDLNLLPIGAYNESWHDIHMNPAEAVDAWEQMEGGSVIPIHWGTYDLALHSWYEPAQLLVELARQKNMPLLMPEPGQWLTLDSKTDHSWWKKYSKELSGS